jgi:hypothetical protein
LNLEWGKKPKDFGTQFSPDRQQDNGAFRWAIELRNIGYLAAGALDPFFKGLGQ